MKVNDIPTVEECEEWVAALRGGDYPQGGGELYDGDGYCCLGVLGESVRGVGRDELEGENYLVGLIHDRQIVLPWESFFGLLNDGAGEVHHSFSDLGRQGLETPPIDDIRRGWTFEQIADYIENHFIPWVQDNGGDL